MKKTTNIAGILTFIFKLSFRTVLFSPELKRAIIIPIHKKGSKSVADNFTPITFLPTISNVFIFKEAVKSRMLDFLNRSSFFHRNQYGFRQGLFTELFFVYEKLIAKMYTI